ncbi:MAG TPA: hypothetical protein VN380_15155, partial [Thermoanaerobaculia bacterium]|nr:hypothetical protein [Thermoanaerobaculia bacterium]
QRTCSGTMERKRDFDRGEPVREAEREAAMKMRTLGQNGPRVSEPTFRPQEDRGLARGERVYGARTSNIAETDLALWSANRGFILTAI